MELDKTMEKWRDGKIPGHSGNERIEFAARGVRHCRERPAKKGVSAMGTSILDIGTVAEFDKKVCGQMR